MIDRNIVQHPQDPKGKVALLNSQPLMDEAVEMIARHHGTLGEIIMPCEDEGIAVGDILQEHHLSLGPTWGIGGY